MERLTSWLFRILIWLDQGLNTLGGPLFNLLHHGKWRGPFGSEDETISSVLGKIQRSMEREIPWRYPVVKSLAWILDKIDRDHSLEAIEEDEAGIS